MQNRGFLIRGRRSASLWASMALATVLLAACGGSSSGGSNATKSSGPDSANKTYTIVLTQLVEDPIVDSNMEFFKKRLADQYGLVEGKNVKYIVKNGSGDVSQAQLLAKSVLDLKPDLVYVIDTPLVVAFHQVSQDQPILFGIMTDPLASKVVDSADHPGGNMTGTSDYLAPSVYFDLLSKILPDAKKIGIVGNTNENNTQISVKLIQKEAETRGLSTAVAPTFNTNAIVSAVKSLKGRADAVIEPADATLSSAFPTLAKAGLDNDLPIIGTGSTSAKAGLLAGVGVDYDQMGSIAADMAAQILLHGADPGSLAVQYGNAQTGLKVGVNTDTAKKLGVTLPDSVTSSADVYP